MHLELRHLRILQAVSEHGSLTRAAAALGISQPTLTKQIQRIEEEFGTPIFSRSRQGAQPTAFGSFVLARTKAVLSNVDEVLAYRPRAGKLTQIRFGGTMPPWVGGLLDRLSEIDPATHVTVHAERAIGSLVDMVLGRRLDLALVADYPGHLMEQNPETVCAVVAIEPVFVAVGARHVLAQEEEVDLSDLADETWVVPHSDGMGWPEHLHDECAEAGFHPEGRYRLTDYQLRRELVATLRAVTACQASFRTDPNIVVKPLRGDPLWMRHLLVWRRDSALAPYGEDLVRTARIAHQEAMQSSPAYSGWMRRRPEPWRGEGLFQSPRPQYR